MVGLAMALGSGKNKYLFELVHKDLNTFYLFIQVYHWVKKDHLYILHQLLLHCLVDLLHLLKVWIYC